MKRYLFSVYALMLAACTVSMTSCSDKDEPEAVDTKIKFTAIETVIAVTPELAEMCDISATYYDTTGEKKTVKMNTTKVKAEFKLGTLSQNIDEWCIITIAEQMKHLPCTAEISLEFSLNGKKPSAEKPNMIVVRDIYGACFNDKGNKVKEGAITFAEYGALGVANDGWENMVKRFNSYFGNVTIAVSKEGDFNYRD